MHRKIIKTADGSTTIYIEDWRESYHSKHGAVKEAFHVFIKNGLELFAAADREISILEIGFGTGLNALVSCMEAEKLQLSVHYEGVEAYPVNTAELKHLNYNEILKTSPLLFDKIHQVPWEEYHPISSHFKLKKRKQLFSEIDDKADFDLIYFDAFGARVQPELWEEAMFFRMNKALRPGGKLVTYSAKGSVRRALQKTGFSVERLPGPPGKREMLRASKP